MKRNKSEDDPAKSPKLHRVPEAATTHLEQYKLLRQEIIVCLQVITHTEVATTIAVGAVYAWLLTNDKLAPIFWFIPPLIVLLGGVRNLFTIIQMHMIAKYLSIIEQTLFEQNSATPGWETYLRKNKNIWYLVLSTGAGFLFWVILFGVTVAFSWYSAFGRK